MNKPLLVMFLGFPGSGKTYFSRQLAKRLQAVMLNGDGLRSALFGSAERIDEIRRRNPSRVYADIFRALDYAAKQTLLAGYSVIYDTQQTKRKTRRDLEKLAVEAGATPVLVWIQTSRETALRRGQERPLSDDSHQYSAEKMSHLIDQFEKGVDYPEPSENVIKISGEVDFEEQYRIFKLGLEALFYG